MSDGLTHNLELPRIWIRTGRLITNSAASIEECAQAARKNFEKEARKLPTMAALKLLSDARFQGLVPEQPTKSIFDQLRNRDGGSSFSSEFVDSMEFEVAQGTPADEIVKEALCKTLKSRFTQINQSLIENQTGRPGSNINALEQRIANVENKIDFGNLAQELISADVGEAVACTWFRGHRVKVFNGIGGMPCRDGSSAASSSLRR